MPENDDPKNNNTPPADDKGNPPADDKGNGKNDNPPEDDEIKFEDDGTNPPEPKKPPADDNPPDDGTLPEDREVIQKEAQRIVNQTVAPIREQAERARVDNEWNKLITTYPELKPYEGKVMRWANSPSYALRAVRDVVMDVAGIDVFTKIGAIRQRKADKEAAEDRGGGSSSRPSSGGGSGEGGLQTNIPSFKGKTAEEIQKIRAEIRQGKYNE